MKPRFKAIALISDFGVQDLYVGVMKGVIARIAAGTQCIDICHTVPQGDIWKAAFLLSHAYAFFPKGTVFLAVVDPGVGSERRPIAVKTRQYVFVGPDNGVLSLAAKKDGIESLYEAAYRDLFTPAPSSTFEGRDLFAPLAAHCALGKKVYKRLNPVPISSLTMLSMPIPEVYDTTVEAKVVYIDSFGNIVIAVQPDDCHRFLKEGYAASFKKKRIRNFYEYYAQAPAAEVFFTISSFGYVEIAVKNGNAAQKLKASVGDRVVFKKSKRR